jgi:hypothetical protein
MPGYMMTKNGLTVVSGTTIEFGTYTCECGYIFPITEDNYQEFEDRNTKPNGKIN